MLNFSKYSFAEKKLGKDFAREKFERIKELIDTGTSFTTLGMPGLGVSYFLRYLSTTNIADFYFVDMYALSSLSKLEYLCLLAKELGVKVADKNESIILEKCREELEKIALKSNKKIVIIFNRFDQLKEEFDRQFLANLRSLRNVSPEKIVMIFTANKPLYEVAPDAIGGTNLHFYSELFYFGRYSEDDLKKLMSINSNGGKPKEIVKKAIDLSGGHNQLCMILLKSESHENYLLDRFVKLQLSELYDYLNYHQKKQLERIVLGKAVSTVDPYLIDIGMVVKEGDSLRLFTPLLAEYIKQTAPIRLPAKENRLFKILKSRLGQVVSKDELFDLIWKDEPELASDWALNALIYRLRKNPGFASSGYIIESHKKVGYILVKA